MTDFPVSNPTENELAGLIGEHGKLRGLRVDRNGDLYVWPAELSWHAPMIGRLEGAGGIQPGEGLDRLILDNAEEVWSVFRDEP